MADEDKGPVKPYEYQPYPKVLYNHATRQTKKVSSKAEHEALGKEWTNKAFSADPAPNIRRAELGGLDEALDPVSLSQRVSALEDKLELELSNMRNLIASLQAGLAGRFSAPQRPIASSAASTTAAAPAAS